MPLRMDTSVENFYKSPGEYLLCIEQKEDGSETILKAERKGCWTWIKANWLCPSAYKLYTIAAELQNNPSQLSTRCADLLLSKITRYNIRHKEAPIAKHFLQNFIKEMDVAKGLSQKRGPATNEPNIAEDFIYSLIVEHLHALTAETAYLPREPLTNILIARLEERYPSHSLTKEEIRHIAVEHYCYIVACNFNRRRKPPIDPDNENIADYFERLRQAMKIDFKELPRLTDNVINKYGKKAFRQIKNEYLDR